MNKLENKNHQNRVPPSPQKLLKGISEVFYAFYAALSWDQMAHIIYYTGSVDFPSWQHHIFHSYRFGGYYAFVVILNSKPHTEFVLISFRQWLNG